MFDDPWAAYEYTDPPEPFWWAEDDPRLPPPRPPSLHPVRQVDVPLIQLPTGEYCFSVDNWSWDFIGLNPVQESRLTGTRRWSAYCVLPNGVEAQPLLYMKQMYSRSSLAWSMLDNVLSAPASLPLWPPQDRLLTITSEVLPGEALERVLMEGDAWVKGWQTSAGLLEHGRNQTFLQPAFGGAIPGQFVQYVPQSAVYDPDELKTIPSAWKRRVLRYQCGIKCNINPEDVFGVQTRYDCVLSFAGIIHRPHTKLAAPFEVQVARFRQYSTVPIKSSFLTGPALQHFIFVRDSLHAAIAAHVVILPLDLVYMICQYVLPRA